MVLPQNQRREEKGYRNHVCQEHRSDSEEDGGHLFDIQVRELLNDFQKLIPQRLLHPVNMPESIPHNNNIIIQTKFKIQSRNVK